MSGSTRCSGFGVKNIMIQTVPRRTVRDQQPLSPEWIERLQACIDDEWPIRQIIETYGVSHQTLKKYFPDYTGADDFELMGAISKLVQKVGL